MAPLVFFLLVVAEVWVIIKVGSHVGALTTVVLIILCSVVGLNIARIQGMGMLRDFQDRLRNGLDADKAAPEGLMLMLAAVLLIIPGFITGIVGMLLLIPFVRRLAAAYVPRLFRNRTVVRHVVFDVTPNRPKDWPGTHEENGRPDIIEVQGKVLESEEQGAAGKKDQGA